MYKRVHTLEEDFKAIGLLMEEIKEEIENQVVTEDEDTADEGAATSEETNEDEIGEDELAEAIKMVRKRKKRRKRMSSADKTASRKASKAYRRSAAGKKALKKRSVAMKKMRKSGKDPSKYGLRMNSKENPTLDSLIEEIQALTEGIEKRVGSIDTKKNLKEGFELSLGIIENLQQSYADAYKLEESDTRQRRIHRRGEAIDKLEDDVNYALEMVNEGKTSFTSKNDEEVALENVLEDVTTVLERYTRYIA